jgi:hypothetical protein
MLITLALIQACHDLSQLNIAALHSQSHPATLVNSQLLCRKTMSSRYLLPATKVDSNVVKGGGMRTWNPFTLAFSIPTQHSYILDCWSLETNFTYLAKDSCCMGGAYILDCWPLETNFTYSAKTVEFYLFNKRLFLHGWCLCQDLCTRLSCMWVKSVWEMFNDIIGYAVIECSPLQTQTMGLFIMTICFATEPYRHCTKG